MFEQYSPKEVVMSCYGFDITGFSEDAMVDIAWDTERYSQTTGVAGEVCVSRAGTLSGSVTIQLLANSPTNGVLEGIYLANEIVYNIIPQEADTLRSLLTSGLSVHNHNNGNIVLAPQAYLSQIPELAYGKDASVRTWKFICPKLVLVPSGGVAKTMGILNAVTKLI